MKFVYSSPYVSAALLALVLGEITSTAYARLRASHTTMDESVPTNDGLSEISSDFNHRALTGISKHADMKVNKVKLQMLQGYSPALAANGSLAGASSCADDTPCDVGFCKDGACHVHPMVTVYMETVKPENAGSIGEGGRHAYDIFVGVSRDDGQTWKRIDVSRSAKQKTTKIIEGTCKGDHGDDEVHEVGDDDGLSGPPTNPGIDGEDQGDTSVGVEYLGDNEKPMVAAKGKRFLVAWTSKYCKGGVGSTNSSETKEFDKYQVQGHQGCHDYTGEGAPDDKIPFGPLVPFSCVWAARGIVENDGTIIITRGERLTSGRRDAFQLVATVAGNGKGWALAWQEDPLGLKTGEAAGPGEGMSGATVNHKTDIWYSYLDSSDFENWSYLPGQGDSGDKTEDHEGDEALLNEYPDDTIGELAKIDDNARFSSPFRVTANAPCRVEVDESVYVDGHPNITRYYGGLYCQDEANCHTIVRQDNTNSPLDTSLWFCKTAEGVILNGNSGASRPNLFLIPTSTEIMAIMGYEESKGQGYGGGSDDHGGEDRLLSDAEETGEHDKNDTDAGKNVTEKEDEGKNVVFQYAGNYKKFKPISGGDILNLPEVDFNGVPKVSSKDNHTLLRNNARRIRFIQQPPSKWGQTQTSIVALWREGEGGHGKSASIMMRRAERGYNFQSFHCQNQRKHPITNEDVCVSGVTNVSGLLETDNQNKTDARAQRGFMRGDFLVIAYTFAEQWGRVGGLGNRYDMYQITSHDGGKKFTDKAGQKRGPVNLSKMKEQGHKGFSVMEPRIYATPGSIDGGAYTKDDLQNGMAYYIGYGTTSNPHQGGHRALGEQPSGSNEPQDLYYSVTFNYGETFYCEANGNYSCVHPAIRKVKGSDDTASFSGLQMRTNPAGNKLYAVYVANNGPGGGTGGGGPCQGSGSGDSGKGYDVCFNSTKKLGPFDGFTDDGLPLPDDFNKLCKENKTPDLLICDVNGDGEYTGADSKLYDELLGEWNRHNTAKSGNVRRLGRDKNFM